VVLVSIIPLVVGVLREWLKKRREGTTAAPPKTGAVSSDGRWVRDRA
jgi:hypothetical protein